MRIISLLLIALLCLRPVKAQESFNDSIAFSRNRLAKDAMLTLGSWAATNMVSGFLIAGHSGGEAGYAWQMNGYWNLINLGLAGMGYISVRKAALKKFSFSENFKAQQAIEKLYVFNFGLDLFYISGGFYLREKGNSRTTQGQKDQFKGYGTSIIVQGGFLLIMDAVMYLLHRANTVRMNSR